MDGLDPDAPPATPHVDEPPPLLPDGHTQFEPLDYFKLKSSLMEIAVLEGQLREQATTLHQRKLLLFANAGIPIGAYIFDDEKYCVIEQVR